ncbi:PREDICTED: thiosulfate sulfurtransferase 18-like [Tarenaya hassleriana]|uniref:thiosulfate sulfurtransferase 18-like n=1 Tax=Tarenaya hassleriana TaxID=28532 RepID=UPI00053C4C37|nr:PREDICTED: thiosulfate sulfurtransferase 18-like [Tarenaya hassleriana]
MGSKDMRSGSEVVTVDVTEAKNLLEAAGHVYLDVRTEEEFGSGHCLAPKDKIFNVPYMFDTPHGREKNPDFLNQVSSLLNQTDDILVGCRSGVRSLDATTDLMAAGYKKASNVGGGYLAWVNKMLPVHVEQPQPADGN